MTHSLFCNCTRKGQSLYTRKEDNICTWVVVLKSSLRLGQCGVLYMCVCMCVHVCVVHRWTCNHSRNFVECYPHPSPLQLSYSDEGNDFTLIN